MLTEPNQRAISVKNQDIIEISVDCWKDSENKLKKKPKYLWKQK